MSNKVDHILLLSKAPLTGQFRYNDTFQLSVAPENYQTPPQILGDYPLILELSYEADIAPARGDDFWHRDQWERSRDKVLTSSPEAGEDWITTFRDSVAGTRKNAIVTELTNLLTVFSGFTFFEYSNGQSWYKSNQIIRKGSPSVWGQQVYRPDNRETGLRRFFNPIRRSGSPVRIAPDGFSDTVGVSATKIPSKLRTNRGQDSWRTDEKHELRIPEDLTFLLDRYFSLEPEKKEAYYASTHLWVQSSDLRSSAPSLSLVAAVAAIETLVRSDEPKLSKCESCKSPTANEYCIDCRAPIYRLTSNFRNFMTTYGGPSLGSFATRLYGYRSEIAHSGTLLRVEIGDMGFNKGGKDEQMLFQIDVPRITRAAMLNWLKAQKRGTGEE